jgi:hypothetical protein
MSNAILNTVDILSLPRGGKTRRPHHLGTFSAGGQVSENLHGDASAGGKASSKSRVPISFRTLLILVLVWVISAVYAGIHLKRGWIPHDEARSRKAQSA